MAWEIIKYLTTSENAQLITFAEIDAYPALTTTYDDPIMREPVPYFGNAPVREIFADVAESMPNAQVTEFDAIALAIWNNTVEAVLNGEVEIEEGYENARREILATIQ